MQTFKDAERSELKGLKQLLRRNGVWVFNKKSKLLLQALYDVAYKDNPIKWLDVEIKLFISTEGPFNSYVINRRLKSRPSTPLMSFATPASAVLNDLPPTAELSLPTNVTAPPTNVKAPPINVMAPPTNVKAPPINVTAPSTNVTAPSINTLNTQPIEAKVTTNYGRDLATLAKIYTEESKYSGEDDNFDRKLTIFNDLYNRVGIL